MNEAVAYNALNIINQSDYRALLKLKTQFGNWTTALKNAGAYEKKSDPEKEWQKLLDLGVRLILREEPDYPALLNEIPHPPFGVYILGNLPKENNLIFAIVGTRKATLEGKELARKFSSELAQCGFKIVSGLALGIDAAAHEGCLTAGGKTVAVLANGLDRFYPATNEKLAKKILSQNGAIVSEYHLGAEPLPFRFLERNRIISGLSRGVLIIEAPRESGSLVTANFALDQNRDVFVVPGPVSHPNFAGSHQLIRKGAELIVNTEEILEAFGLSGASPLIKTETFNIPEEKTVFDTLKKLYRPSSVDKIVEMTNLKTSLVNQALSFLLIKNLIKETNDGYTINK